jgi:hypothetical protein
VPGWFCADSSEPCIVPRVAGIVCACALDMFDRASDMSPPPTPPSPTSCTRAGWCADASGHRRCAIHARWRRRARVAAGIVCQRAGVRSVRAWHPPGRGRIRVMMAGIRSRGLLRARTAAASPGTSVWDTPPPPPTETPPPPMAHQTAGAARRRRSGSDSESGDAAWPAGSVTRARRSSRTGLRVHLLDIESRAS